MKMKWCTPMVMVAMIGLLQTTDAQDRIDEVTQSAARIQGTESFGQPYERGQDSYQGGQGFYEDGFRSGQQRSYGQGPYGQRQYGQSQYGQGQYQADGAQNQWNDQWGDQYGRRSMQSEWRGGDTPAGLGVVLRETGDRGVQVVEVHQGSPAEQAGIRPGDQILAINNQRTDSVQELQSTVMQQEPGEQVQIVALRNGREQTFDARLETRGRALNQRQQARYQGGQSRQYQQQGAQDRQVQARLASLERQLQQLLREVQTLRSQAGRSGSSQFTSDYPQPPRQAQRQGGQQWQDDRFSQDRQQWQDESQRQQRRQQQSQQRQTQGRMDDQYDRGSGGRDQFDF